MDANDSSIQSVIPEDNGEAGIESDSKLDNEVNIQKTALQHLETVESNKSKSKTDIDKENINLRLPITKIKKIMKLDPELNLSSQDAVFLIAKATEFFIESLIVESTDFTKSANKKTVQKVHVDKCVEKIDALAFLDGAL